MSAEAIEPVPTVHDYEHPEWCNLSLCEPGIRHSSGVEGVHQSSSTAWGTQCDEAEFGVALVLSDDHNTVGTQQGRAHVLVSLQNLANVPASFADAWVDPEDARMFAKILTRYADRADNHNRFSADIAVAASELPSSRR